MIRYYLILILFMFTIVGVMGGLTLHLAIQTLDAIGA